MRESSLKTHMKASALLRHAQSEGAFAYVMQKGDPDNGIILVKMSSLDGLARLYSPSRNMDGDSVYRASAALPESEVTQMILKRMKYDPDLWVIEIEDKAGRHFLTDPVETS